MAFYKSDIVDINLEVGKVFRSFAGNTLGDGDVLADRFGIRAFRNGVPQDLTGASCQALFYKADGVTYALTQNGTVDGNVAYVTLPAACYNVKGPFTLAIRLVGGGVTGTMRIVDGVIVDTHSMNPAVTPYELPTYAEILAQYDEMAAATAAANGCIAKLYSELTFPVPAGTFCIKDGSVYVANQYIATTEAWTSSHWTGPVTFGDQLTGAKTSISSDDIEMMKYFGTHGKRNFIVPKKSKFYELLKFDLTSGQAVTFSLTLGSALSNNCWLYLKDGSGNNLFPGGERTIAPGTTSWTYDYTPAQDYANATLSISLSGSGTEDATILAVSATLKNVTIMPLYQMYSTMQGWISEQGNEFDGKLEDLEESLYSVSYGKNRFNPSEAAAGILNDNGTVGVNNDYTVSGFIQISNNTTYFFSARSSPDTAVITTTRHIACLYDADKNFISGSTLNVNPTTGLAIAVSNANAKYMRVSVHEPLASNYFQVEVGSASTSYEAYSETKNLLINLGDSAMEQVTEAIPGEVDEIFEEYQIPVYQTKQLFDRTNNTVGYCDTSGYKNTSDTNYVFTEMFPVTAGKTVYFSSDGTAKNARFVTAYDAQGAAVSASGASGTIYTYTVPSGIAYIRVSYSNPASSSSFAHFQAEYDEITSYAVYGKYFNIDSYLGTDNVLYNKKWAVCGDSFTAGVTEGTIQSGKYAGQKKVYPYFIGNRNNMNIVKFFEGGRTLAWPASPGTFVNSLTNPNAAYYYQNIPSDADYITIYLGINDAGHASGSSQDGEDTTGVIPLGTIDDNTTATYYGAWNVVLTWLITNRPNAHIGIIVTNGIAGADSYRQAQIAIATKYGIPYIDLNGDARTPAMLRTSNPNIPSSVKNALIAKWRVSADNTHPNDAAHEFEATFIENFLRSI